MNEHTERLTPHELNEKIARLMGWKRRRSGIWEWGKEPKERVYADDLAPRERDVPEAAPERYDHRSYSRIPAYIYDIALAWELVRQMPAKGFSLWFVPDEGWQARFYDDAGTFKAVAEAAPLAICVAFFEWKTSQRIEILAPPQEG